ncbi:MAG: M20/M25/M40 family metallo-hydrolase, partial [Clostridia bacterium]|nr:M20/M25/M40 family metallo-hydrolase [Clostridia bacterium]
RLPLKTHRIYGTPVTLCIKGLSGGHSGVEINKNRVNANIIAGRIIACLKPMVNFGIIEINGGDKANAIPNGCKIKFCAEDEALFCDAAKKCIDIIKDEIWDREPRFDVQFTVKSASEFDVFDCDTESNITKILLCAPNGVMEMSAGIEGLVQTSLNLGILSTKNDCILLHFSLRSNKQSSLVFLEERLGALFNILNIPTETFGHYPPWEYRENSPLRDIYCSVYRDTFGKECKVEAIHAGLECGVFDSAIDDFDCIAIGPALYDIHTTRERLSISSTEKYYNLIIKILEKLK